MCFSANANFIAAAGIAAIGVATLRHVKQPRAVLFGAVPLLFALHQFTEGFVWLGVDNEIRPEALGHMTFLFILYAQGILPVLMPLAVLLMEKQGWRFNAILALTVLGGALCAYVLYALIAFHSDVVVENHSLAYRNPGTYSTAVAIVYVLATTGALVLSSHQVVRWFGWLNVVGIVGTMVVRSYAFTSIWCAYAALVSVILYWQFSRGTINVERPNSSLLGRVEAVAA